MKRICVKRALAMLIVGSPLSLVPPRSIGAQATSRDTLDALIPQALEFADSIHTISEAPRLTLDRQAIGTVIPTGDIRDTTHWRNVMLQADPSGVRPMANLGDPVAIVHDNERPMSVRVLARRLVVVKHCDKSDRRWVYLLSSPVARTSDPASAIRVPQKIPAGVPKIRSTDNGQTIQWAALRWKSSYGGGCD